MHRQHVRILYKSILRLHRSLPKEIKELGDVYVKDEFRRHKNIAPELVPAFMMEWANYCATLANQVGPKNTTSLGKTLEVEKLDNFEEQQILQLYELKKSIEGDINNDVSSQQQGTTAKRKTT